MGPFKPLVFIVANKVRARGDDLQRILEGGEPSSEILTDWPYPPAKFCDGEVPASASSIRRSAEIDGKIIRAELAETEGNYIGAEIRFSNSIVSIRGLECTLPHTSVKFALQEASIDKKLKVQHLALFATHTMHPSPKL